MGKDQAKRSSMRLSIFSEKRMTKTASMAMAIMPLMAMCMVGMVWRLSGRGSSIGWVNAILRTIILCRSWSIAKKAIRI
jgi:uncharacterized membrane protein YfbV (UPF0208 family)